MSRDGGRAPCLKCKQFFGTAENMGLCSGCYQALMQESVDSAVQSAPVRRIGTIGEAEGKQSKLRSEIKIGAFTVQVRIGDLTCETVDCIVNAANSYLDHAAGLAGAIVRNGGRVIQDESDAIVRRMGRLQTGDVVMTTAGRLPCKRVLHAVGPIWKDGKSGEEMYLQICVRACLDKAEELKFTSIAMPAISSGIFGFPKDLCAKVLFETTFAYMQEKAGHAGAVTEIRFTNFDEQTTKLFEEEAARWKSRLEGSAAAPSPLRAAGAAAAAGTDTGFRPTVGEAAGKESTVRAALPETLGARVEVRLGDLTCERVDCIVNAANSSLDHAAGLAGAIVRQGGAVIQQESDRYVMSHGRLQTGDVCVTTAGALPCKKVLHAVGPIWKDGKCGEPVALQVCVRTCLDKAEELGFKSIAMPAISSGIFGFPKDLCAKVLFETVVAYVKERAGQPTCLREIRFTNFDEQTTKLFEEECARIAAILAAPPAADSAPAPRPAVAEADSAAGTADAAPGGAGDA